MGEALTRWTVRLAVACYLARVVLDLPGGRTRTWTTRTQHVRWFWTAGCILLVVHILCAFGFYHRWSHQAAYRHTAEQTAAVTGLDWGGGLYVNYAFALFWAVDVAVWWRRGRQFPCRSRGYLTALHSVFALMMINATVVFGPPFWRWLAPAVLLLLAIAYLRRRR